MIPSVTESLNKSLHFEMVIIKSSARMKIILIVIRKVILKLSALPSVMMTRWLRWLTLVTMA